MIVALSFAVLSLAEGHGLGQSLEKEVGDYIIDVGYDAIDKIEVGEATRFDFNLWNQSKTDIADFDHVWVRIAPKDEGLSFAGFLYRPEFLLTGMSYTFEKSGEYELTVRFVDKEDKTLAEATFPLTIEDTGSSFSADTITGILIGIMVGVVATFFIVRKRKSQ